MLIPRIRPNQFKDEPDQVCRILNLLIDSVNALQNKK